MKEKKKQKPMKTIPIDYNALTYDQLIEIIVYAQEELYGRGILTKCKEDTLGQKFIR